MPALASIRARRGVEADLASPSGGVQEHEFLWTTDTHRLWVWQDSQAWSVGIISPLTTIGDLWCYEDTIGDSRLPAGTDGQILSADSGEATGLKWIDPTSASSPLTTLGDLWCYSTTDDRLPVGTDGQILYADSGEPTGLRWDDPPVGGSGDGGYSRTFMHMGS